MKYSVQFWIEIVIYQVASGSISFAASSLIVYFIALKGLSTPYRRIIFGLSMSDICQSFAALAGPFLAPSDAPQALWGIGCGATCLLDGFLYHLGMTAVPMYTVFLCVYYVCKLKKKMSDEEFTRRIEKKVHSFIIVINLVLYFSAVVMDVIEPTFMGNYCAATSLPTCDENQNQNPELESESESIGECDEMWKEGPVRLFILITYLVVPVFSLLAIIICIISIFWHVVMRERIFGRSSTNVHTRSAAAFGNTESNTGHNMNIVGRNRHLQISGSGGSSSVKFSECQASRTDHVEDVASLSSIHNHHSQEDVVELIPSNESENFSTLAGANVNTFPSDARLDNSSSDTNPTNRQATTNIGANTSDANGVGNAETLSRLYKKELLSQMICYVMVFCLIILPFLVLFLARGASRKSDEIAKNNVRAISILHPLGGLFNIIVYTRWNVRSWRRCHPECSRLRAFWLVLKAGGDLPKEDDDSPRTGTSLTNRAASRMSTEQFGAVSVMEGRDTPGSNSGPVNSISSPPEVNGRSAATMGGMTSSLEEGDLHLKGDTSSSAILDTASNATTIKHANCSDRSELSSVVHLDD